jgi:hypothetical protein
VVRLYSVVHPVHKDGDAVEVSGDPPAFHDVDGLHFRWAHDEDRRDEAPLNGPMSRFMPRLLLPPVPKCLHSVQPINVALDGP